MTIATPGQVLDQYLLSDRFRPFPHVVWARHTDATVLLDVERGLYYTLNDVAGRAWELLVAGEPLIEILRLLGDEYEAPPETLWRDIPTLIEHLIDAALIERLRP